MNKQAETEIRKAVSRIVNRFPLYWTVWNILKDNLKEGGCETMATDGESLFYNAKFVLANKKFLNGVVTHEFQHVARLHPWREGDRDHAIWAWSCEHPINFSIEFELPSGVARDVKYRGWSEERIYNDIARRGKSVKAPNCLMKNNNAAKMKKVESEVKKAVTNAKLFGGGRGLVDDPFLRELLGAEEIPDYSGLLDDFKSDVLLEHDYSYTRPNIKYTPYGIYLPSLRPLNGIGELTIAIDTSGSIRESDLKLFQGAVTGLLDGVTFEKVNLIDCDMKVRGAKEYLMGDDIKLICHGGGGTDFRPVFKWIEENVFNPAGLVYLTDGAGDYPSNAPAYPVIWIMTTKDAAPFGRSVMIEKGRQNEHI